MGSVHVGEPNITAMCSCEDNQLYHVVVPEGYRRQGRAKMLLLSTKHGLQKWMKYQVTARNNDAHKLYKKMHVKYGLQLMWIPFPEDNDSSKIAVDSRVRIFDGNHSGKYATVVKMSSTNKAPGVMVNVVGIGKDFRKTFRQVFLAEEEEEEVPMAVAVAVHVIKK